MFDLKRTALCLFHPDREVRWSTVKVLEGMGRAAIPYLIEALLSSDNVVRCSAAAALRGHGGKAAPLLVEAIRGGDGGWLVREEATRVLTAIEADAAVPALLGSLTRDGYDDCVFDSLLAVLEGIEVRERPPFLDKLRGFEEEDYRWTAWAYGVDELDKKEDIPALTALAEHEDSLVRSLAVGVLGPLGDRAPEIVGVLGSALDDADSRVRRSAGEAFVYALVYGLFNHFPRSVIASIIPALIKALSDSDPEVRKNASFALGEVGAEAGSAVRALTGRLADPDDEVRWRAVQALGKIGPAAAEAVPDLERMLSDPSEVLQVEAAGALGLIGHEVERNCRFLVGMLKEGRRDLTIRLADARSLECIGPAAAPVVPELLRIFRQGEEEAASLALIALEGILPQEEALPLLIEEFNRSITGRGKIDMNNLQYALHLAEKIRRSGSSGKTAFAYCRNALNEAAARSS